MVLYLVQDLEVSLVAGFVVDLLLMTRGKEVMKRNGFTVKVSWNRKHRKRSYH